MKIQFSFIQIPINHSWVDLLFQFFLAVLSPPLKKDLLNPRGFTHIQQINSQGQCNHHTSNYITNYSWFCRLSSIHSFVFVSLSPKLFEQEYFFFWQMNNSILSLIIFLDFSHELLISNLNYMIKLIVQREVNDIIMRINIYSKVFKGCTHVLMVADKILKMCPMSTFRLVGILHILQYVWLEFELCYFHLSSQKVTILVLDYLTKN
jgi:hypothetical protein